MNSNIKKFVSYLLIGIVLVITIVTVLAIWGLIDIDPSKRFNC